ncbi:PREDICTED: protein FLX-like 1 isoform X3 [Ipomoea nil]|uniref:protein FLX-like 1 isoform X3 n=1 Tax=Ipomoea nil TaxID=35883 RepID=UPI0009013A11|nr:PREDICTED: protein FLX-like 1 isoform X3 [Ipomoea nil]XP_019160020.1 PREDICTED: protein FLX-like 1 isoform X3 [Ipomoea nil]
MAPPIHEPPPFARGRGPVPVMLEEMRERQIAPHPAILEEHLAAQHEDIQGLLVDNQRLAATHVALKEELEVTQFDLQRTDQYARALYAENDMQIRELYEKSAKMEMDLQSVEVMRVELMRVRADVKDLNAAKQELTTELQGMTQDLTRMNADMQRTPVIKAEIENLRQELQRSRAAIENEKKGYAANYEHGQVMQKNLHSMSRELEKLRAEMANAEKKARAAASVGNPGFCFQQLQVIMEIMLILSQAMPEIIILLVMA